MHNVDQSCTCPQPADFSCTHSHVGVAAGGSLWLQPTKLASLLAAKSGAGASAADGFVIVETNYR